MENPPNISEKEPSYMEFGNLDVGQFANDSMAVMLISKV
jgi:hypothetical protein